MSKLDVAAVRSVLGWFRAHAWVRWPVALGLLVFWWTAFVHQGFWYELLGGPWHTVRWCCAVPTVLLLALLTERHRGLLVGLLVASPAVLMPAYFVADAVVEYNEGKAVVYSGGLPSVMHDVDPELGIPMRYTGCIVSEVSELRAELNNATLEVLVEWFGPMPGTQY